MPTLRELSEKKAKVAVIAHQGRPGDWDFCSLEGHAKILSKHLGKEVRYVDDLYGEKAIAAIKAMRPGDVIVLKNVRELACEQDKKSMDEHSTSEMVQVLSKVADIYVSDAFGSGAPGPMLTYRIPGRHCPPPRAG